MRFTDLVGVGQRPANATAAEHAAVATDSYANELSADPRNNGFVTGLVDRRRARRVTASRRGFLKGTIAAAAATTAAGAAGLFGPARKVGAQTGVVGTYPRRILQFCPPYNANDNCQPGCGSSPICTDCCGADGFFRNDPSNGYTLYAGGCGDGDIADGWLWRFSGKCGNCAEIEYRCSDGYVQTDTGPAPFICRAVTDCVPLADGEEAGPDLPDAARDTNWRPAGALELAVDQGGSIALSGWIADGSGVPIQMRVRANNSIVHLGTASLARPDIPASRRGASPNVGFGVSFPIEPGEYEFCVDALAGVLTATIGCVRLVAGSGASAQGSSSGGSITTPAPAPASNSASENSTEPSSPPPTPTEVAVPDAGPLAGAPTYGAVQVIRRSASTTGFVSGWAGDPDTEDPVYVEVLVDDEAVATVRTDLPRPDVAAAFDGLHPQTGFAISFPLPADTATVCVQAISAADGYRQPLGCQQLTAAADAEAETTPERPSATGQPTNGADIVYGGVDTVDIVGDQVRITGWSFDPNDRDRVIAVRASAAGEQISGETGLPNAAAQQIYGVDASCGFELVLPGLRSGLHDLVIEAMANNQQAKVIAEQVIVIA